MHIIGFVLFGILIGVLASRLVSGEARRAWGLSAGVGAGGSLLGGFLGRPTGLYGDTEPTAFTMALIAAFASVTVYQTLARRRREAARLEAATALARSAR